MAVFERYLLLEGPIFHFHDYRRKGNMAPENRPSQEANSLPTINLQVLCWWECISTLLKLAQSIVFLCFSVTCMKWS